MPLEPADWGDDCGGYLKTAGVSVSHQKAMRLAAFFQAVNLLSGDIAKLPLEVFARDGEDRTVDQMHPAQWLVRWQANDDQTAYEFWQDFATHFLVWRNAYAYIERDGNGMPTALLPLLPDRTAPETIRGRRYYVSEIDNRLEMFPAYDVLHVRGPSFGGKAGLDMVYFGREVLGKALARQGAQSKFFQRGLRVGGFFQLPEDMPNNIKQKWESKFRTLYENTDNAFQTMVFKDRVKFVAAQATFRDAQLLEVSQEDIREVARLFNCPPHKLGDKSAANYNTLEQENRAYYDSCLGPWLANIKAALWSKLLSKHCRNFGCHFFDYNVGALLWADVKTVSDIANAGIQTGLITRNEGRRWFNLNGQKGGDVPLIPVNLMPDPAYADKPNQGGDDQQTGPGVTTIDDGRAKPPALKCSPEWFAGDRRAILEAAGFLKRNEPLPAPAPVDNPPPTPPADKGICQPPADKLRAIAKSTELDARRRFIKRLTNAATRAAAAKRLVEWAANDLREKHLPIGREMFELAARHAAIADPEAKPVDHAAAIVTALAVAPASILETLAALSAEGGNHAS